MRRLLLPPRAIPSIPTWLGQLKYTTTRKGQDLEVKYFLFFFIPYVLDSLEKGIFPPWLVSSDDQRSLKSALPSGFNRGMHHPATESPKFP